MSTFEQGFAEVERAADSVLRALSDQAKQARQLKKAAQQGNIAAMRRLSERVALGELLTPEWRFLMAAVLATVISQLVDTEIYTRWVARFGQEKQWGRVLFSNLVSIPLDRVIFLLLAFAGAESTDMLIEMFIGTSIVRLVFGIISIPGVYLVEDHAEDWAHITEIGQGGRLKHEPH